MLSSYRRSSQSETTLDIHLVIHDVYVRLARRDETRRRPQKREAAMDAVPVGKKTLCTDDLRRRILTQELDPGSYLDEVDIGQTYGISRPPVREVLRQLAGEGYVVLHEN